MEVPAHILAAVLAVSPAAEAPEAVEDAPGGLGPVDRTRFPVVLGWEPGSNWRYDGDPNLGAVASIPVKEGCCSSHWGDRAYFRSAVFGWNRGRVVLTPEGVEFLSAGRS